MQPPPAPPAAELLPRSLLARWQQSTTEPGATVVLPDGCCDLILHVDAAGRPAWQVSPLADAAVTVPGAAHEFWRGYRLRPGTVVQAPALIRAAQAIWSQAARRASWSSQQVHIDTTVEQQLLDAIDAHTHLEARVEEALHTLAHTATVAAAARSLGVSERSLERLTRAATQQPPSYWRALAWCAARRRRWAAARRWPALRPTTAMRTSPTSAATACAGWGSRRQRCAARPDCWPQWRRRAMGECASCGSAVCVASSATNLVYPAVAGGGATGVHSSTSASLMSAT